MDVTFDRHRDYDYNYFGIITSYVERINDVHIYLERFGVIDLIPYLWIDEKMKAFLYKASLLDRKGPIRVVEIYYDWDPHGTEWRKRGAQFALRLDGDLVDGLDDDIAITDFVIPVGRSAVEEGILSH